MNANGTAPNDLFYWNNNTIKHNSYNGYVILLLTDAQWLLLCAWSFLEAVVELSSSFSAISLCLLSSPVQTQLMLIVPHWGPRAPRPQNGVPTPRVHAHSLPRVQNSNAVFSSTNFSLKWLSIEMNWLKVYPQDIRSHIWEALSSVGATSNKIWDVTC